MGTRAVLLWVQMSTTYSEAPLATGPGTITVRESCPARVQGFGIETIVQNDMAEEICPNTIQILHHRFEVRHMTGPKNEQALLMQTCATHLCFYFNLAMHDCHISGCLYAKKRGSIKGRLKAVQPPIGTVIITLSGGHKSSTPHPCQVSWH